MITAQDAVILGNAELERGMRAAQAVAVVFTLPALILGMLALGLRDWAFAYGSGGVFGLGMCLAAALIVQGHRKGQGHVVKVIEHNHKVYAPKLPQIIEGETLPELPTGTLNALPTLPANDFDASIPVRSGGGVVRNVARNLMRGFEPQDVDWLARYLSNGGKFTEAAMEKIPLPASFEVMGKAQDGTAYTRFMEWCVEAAVIVGREGKKSGTLAITDRAEIMAALKAAA